MDVMDGSFRMGAEWRRHAALREAAGSDRNMMAGRGGRSMRKKPRFAGRGLAPATVSCVSMSRRALGPALE
jgi:hypothetical protein